MQTKTEEEKEITQTRIIIESGEMLEVSFRPGTEISQGNITFGLLISTRKLPNEEIALMVTMPSERTSIPSLTLPRDDYLTYFITG